MSLFNLSWVNNFLFRPPVDINMEQQILPKRITRNHCRQSIWEEILTQIAINDGFEWLL